MYAEHNIKPMMYVGDGSNQHYEFDPSWTIGTLKEHLFGWVLKDGGTVAITFNDGTTLDPKVWASDTQKYDNVNFLPYADLLKWGRIRTFSPGVKADIQEPLVLPAIPRGG